MDYWDVDVQNEIENLTKTFENSTFISSPLYTESWVRSFVNYVNRNQEELNVTIDTRETFLQTLNDVRIERLRIIYLYNIYGFEQSTWVLISHRLAFTRF